MRQDVSVIMLAVKSTFARMIAIFTVMAVVEAMLFYRLLQKNVAGEYGRNTLSLESLITISKISYVFAVAFCLLCILLCSMGCEFKGGKVRYTIQRLQISELRITVLWGMYHCLCFLMLWAVQLIVTLILCKLYMIHMDSIYWPSLWEGYTSRLSEQTIFVACYRNIFLHNLLPLQDCSRYIRNIALVLALGFSTSIHSYRQRHDVRGFTMIVLAVLTIHAFQYNMALLGKDLQVIIIGSVAVFMNLANGVWWPNED